MLVLKTGGGEASYIFITKIFTSTPTGVLLRSCDYPTGDRKRLKPYADSRDDPYVPVKAVCASSSHLTPS